MSSSGLRLLAPAICAVALATVATTAFAKSRASTVHVKKHFAVHRHYRLPSAGFGYPQPAAGAWSARPSQQAGDVCPGGIHRSFECRVWPPPIEDDPDRVIGGAAAD